VKKTSIYLSDDDRERLARLAEREGKSKALVLREALAMYDASQPDRNFQIFNIEVDPEAPGIPHFETAQAFQDWLDAEGLKGMGEDSFGDVPLP
jgi:predicted transcriptional regulator